MPHVAAVTVEQCLGDVAHMATVVRTRDDEATMLIPTGGQFALMQRPDSRMQPLPPRRRAPVLRRLGRGDTVAPPDPQPRCAVVFHREFDDWLER